MRQDRMTKNKRKAIARGIVALRRLHQWEPHKDTARLIRDLQQTAGFRVTGR